MRKNTYPSVCRVSEVEPRQKPSNYPAPFAERMTGRVKRAIGDVFGLQHFGVNHTTLAPGAQTALRHAHTVQDELVYVLAGTPLLIDDDGEHRLSPGMCAGTAGGQGRAAHIVNDTEDEVTLLEIGDRLPGDSVAYPDDDLAATFEDGRWRFLHKDGRPY